MVASSLEQPVLRNSLTVVLIEDRLSILVIILVLLVTLIMDLHGDHLLTVVRLSQLVDDPLFILHLECVLV